MNPDAEHVKAFHVGFRAWLSNTYTEGPTEEQLQAVLTRDEQHDYMLYPTTPSPEEIRSAITEDDSASLSADPSDESV